MSEKGLLNYFPRIPKWLGSYISKTQDHTCPQYVRHYLRNQDYDKFLYIMSPVANNKNFSLVLLSVFGFEHIFFSLKLIQPSISDFSDSCKHFLNATFCLLLFSVICVFFFSVDV